MLHQWILNPRTSVSNSNTLLSGLTFLIKSSKSKNQVVHEQKFKDLLSSTCHITQKGECSTWNQRTLKGGGGTQTITAVIESIWIFPSHR